MDQLAYELAELLDTSVDKVAGVYQILKDQVVTYRMLGVARGAYFRDCVRNRYWVDDLYTLPCSYI